VAEPGRIALGHDRFALVSAEDFERVSAFTWCLKRRRSDPNRLYAQRVVRVTPGRKGKKLTISMHRFILGAQAGEVVDHINGDGLDNRRENIRLCTNRENSQNICSSKNTKRGGFKGVNWHPKGKKWQAAIGAGTLKPNGKRKLIYLGLFKSAEDAARAYDRAAREHFGAFARTNFPDAANDSDLLTSEARRR
jgi:hypothetical protein